jgi:hypothetical protein
VINAESFQTQIFPEVLEHLFTNLRSVTYGVTDIVTCCTKKLKRKREQIYRCKVSKYPGSPTFLALPPFSSLPAPSQGFRFESSFSKRMRSGQMSVSAEV